LWWGWQAEQKTIAQLRGHQATLKFKPIGPERLRWALGDRFSLSYRSGGLRNRNLIWGSRDQGIGFSIFNTHPGANFGRLRIEQFQSQYPRWPRDTQPIGTNWPQNRRAGPCVPREIARGFPSLLLMGKWVPKAGFQHIGQLKHVKDLDLYGTGMNDADLQQLKGLSFAGGIGSC